MTIEYERERMSRERHRLTAGAFVDDDISDSVRYTEPWPHADGTYGVCLGITCDCPKQDNATNGKPHIHTLPDGDAVILNEGDWVSPVSADGVYCKIIET